MKRYLLLEFFSILYFPVLTMAKSDITKDIYRRNSLCTYFISPIDLSVSEAGVQERVREYLDKFQVSDKYDNHTIGNRYVSVNNIRYTNEDFLAIDPSFRKLPESKSLNIKYSPSQYHNRTQYQSETGSRQVTLSEEERQFLGKHPEIFTAKTATEYKENTIILAAKIYRYIMESKLPNQLIAKWFNAKNTKVEGSHYDLSLIQERGLYNASELDVLRASQSVRKWSVLEDAGMELIPHTFISFTHFEIIDGRKYHERNSLFWKSGSIFGEKFDKMAQRSSDGFAETSAGFYITATTYLFQLEWTEETLQLFIEKYWNADLSTLMNSTDFKVKYLGYERTMTKTVEDVRGKNFFQRIGSVVKEGFDKGVSTTYFGESERSVDQRQSAAHESSRKDKTVLMTEQALIRSVDATYAALQKSHEEFKVKAPLIDVEGNKITAFIGLKEGVNKSTKFEVLERIYDEKKGVYSYKKVATLKVDKDRIWDNRYTLIDSDRNSDEIDRTYLKGNAGNLAPGLLIRQIK